MPNKSETPNKQTSNPAFLGKQAEILSWLIEKQTKKVFEEAGIVIPVKSCSIINCLHRTKGASAADMAKALDQSHQLVIQKIPALIKLKLISCRNDPQDLRRKEYRLTSKGKTQAGLLENSIQQFENVYLNLAKETGVNLFDAITETIGALRRSELKDRLANKES